VFELISDVLGSSIETFSLAPESTENDQTSDSGSYEFDAGTDT